MRNPSIERAERRVEHARQMLAATVADEYPVGSVLGLNFGPTPFTGKVVGHGKGGPEYMEVKNIKTGTVRRVPACCVMWSQQPAGQEVDDA